MDGGVMRLLVAIAVLLASVQVAFAQSLSVKTYGAIGDAKLITDVTSTLGSGIITSASAAFVAGDVGKVAWCIGQGAAVANPLIAVTTITARASGTQVTLGLTANDTTTGSRCVYGTADDTAAFTAAYAAALPPTNEYYPTGNPLTWSGPASTILIPKGGYIVGSRIYNKQDGGLAPAPSLVGEGPLVSMIFPKPNITIPGDGSAVLIQATGQGGRFADFGVDGQGMSYGTFQGGQDLIRFIGMKHFTVERLQLANIGQTTNTDSAVLSIMESSYGDVRNVRVQDGASGSLFWACNLTGVSSVVVTSTFCSNQYRSVLVANNRDRSPTTIPLVWVGGGADECGSTTTSCTKLQDGQLNATGMVFYGPQGSSAAAVDVDATSTLWITMSNVGMFNGTTTGIGATIASGGKIVSSMTTWRGNSTSKAVANSGIFVDAGGNDYKSCTSTTCTTKLPSQAFSGKQPVKQ